jgi:hypothetical protein
MKIGKGTCLGLAALGLLVPLAYGHFQLLAPASWIEENQLGDPQKLGPCGGTSANSGTPTNAVTNAQGGQKLHIKVQETVYHPGHYRVALAVNSRAELPVDPVVTTRDTDKGPWSVSAKIDDPPKPPVLADGLWQHTAKTAEPFEADIPIPNINCSACILQIVQFMAEHGYNKDGGYIYHHCAVLKITADPAMPIDMRWPAAH